MTAFKSWFLNKNIKKKIGVHKFPGNVLLFHLSPFQSKVSVHFIGKKRKETIQLIYSANQMTGFYAKCKHWAEMG